MMEDFVDCTTTDTVVFPSPLKISIAVATILT